MERINKWLYHAKIGTKEKMYELRIVTDNFDSALAYTKQIMQEEGFDIIVKLECKEMVGVA